MVQTVLEIYNAALSAVGSKGRLLTTGDKSKGAEECNIWFDAVVRMAQEAAYWSCCRQMEYLTPLNERDFNVNWATNNPDPKFRYSFGLPTDLLRPWHLANMERFDLRFDNVLERTVLSTNTQNPVLTYAAFRGNPVHWTANLRMAVVHGLAAYISIPITGDQTKQRTNVQLADLHIQQARTISANYTEDHYEHVPEELAARGYAMSSNPTRYYYPLGTTFVGALVNA